MWKNTLAPGLLDTYLQSRTVTSGYPSPSPDILTLPILVNAWIGNHYRVCDLFSQMVVLASLVVKLLLVGAWFTDPTNHELMLCLFPSSPPRLISLALEARTQSNNTAEMTAMIEALSLTRNEQWCDCFDSLHAAGLCSGTIQNRTHVQLAFRVKDPWFSLSANFDSPCNMFVVPVEILVICWPCRCIRNLRIYVKPFRAHSLESS